MPADDRYGSPPTGPEVASRALNQLRDRLPAGWTFEDEAASATLGAELEWLRAQLQAWWRSLRRAVRSWGLQSLRSGPLQEPGPAMPQSSTPHQLLWLLHPY